MRRSPGRRARGPQGAHLRAELRLRAGMLRHPRQIRPGQHQRVQRLVPGQVRHDHHDRHAEPRQLDSRHRQQRRRGGPGPDQPGNNVTIRGSVHGDVLHSRPQIVNYGGSDGHRRVLRRQRRHAARGVRGCQQRELRGRQDGRAGNVGVRRPGNVRQVQAPARPDAGRLDAQRGSTPAVSPAPQHRDYFFDGGIGLYRTSSRTVIYATARRGGNFIYAIDVTDPTSPSLLWKIDNTTAGFTNLGQTWSTPQVGFVRGQGQDQSGALFRRGVLRRLFGLVRRQAHRRRRGLRCRGDVGAELPAVAADGRGVYVVDLGANATSTTPTVLKFFQATWNNGATIGSSVAADVTLLDRDGDGYIDRIYAADMGAQCGAWTSTTRRPPTGSCSSSPWRSSSPTAPGTAKNSSTVRTSCRRRRSTPSSSARAIARTRCRRRRTIASTCSRT